ncbi:hypothetical protein BV375_11245, partial [Nostoc sp. 106C]
QSQYSPRSRPEGVYVQVGRPFRQFLLGEPPRSDASPHDWLDFALFLRYEICDLPGIIPSNIDSDFKLTNIIENHVGFSLA